MARYTPASLVVLTVLVGGACTPSASTPFTAADTAVNAEPDNVGAADANTGLALPDTWDSEDTADLSTAADISVPVYLAGKVDEAGPYRVGFRVASVTYTPTAVTDGEPVVLPERTLRVAIWYPAASPLGDAATYSLGIFRPNIHVDAPVLGTEAMPVLIYSHGHPGFAEASFFLSEHFASHGFLVVAPDHTGDGLADDPARTNDSYLVRPLDISALLDWLANLPADDPLAGRASPSVVLAGHSFGGFTAFSAGGGVWDVDDLATRCGEGWDSPFCVGFDAAHQAAYRHGLGDPRIDALIPMAAGDAFAFAPSGLAQLPVPTLLVTGGHDLASADAMSGDLLWDALAVGSGSLRLALPWAGHLTFTDTCDALGQLSAGDGCDGPPYIAPAEAHRIINTYALAFVRARLFQDSKGQDLLDGRILVAAPESATLTER